MAAAGHGLDETTAVEGLDLRRTLSGRPTPRAPVAPRRQRPSLREPDLPRAACNAMPLEPCLPFGAKAMKGQRAPRARASASETDSPPDRLYGGESGDSLVPTV